MTPCDEHYFFPKYAKGLHILILNRRMFYTTRHKALGRTSNFLLFGSDVSIAFLARDVMNIIFSALG